MTTLSEGRVVLTRNHESPGVLVHTETRGGFLSLQCVLHNCIDDNQPNDVVVVDPTNERNNVSFKMIIGTSPNALFFQFESITSAQTLIQNIWINSGEQVWITTSHPRCYIVHGVSMQRPLAFT